MAQLFHRSTNTLAKLSIYGTVFLLAGLAWAGYALVGSDYMTGVGVPREQQVPFSHKHHVQGLGIDCRYCHTAVETSAMAGIPPTETCMTCHSQVWTDTPMLEPVRESYRTGRPLEWLRVHDLPDFVYFNHSVHLKKGIGCTTCHGQVDQMPLMWNVHRLEMAWCLDCHRQPERYVRPRDRVFDVSWTPPADQLEMGKRLVEEYNIQRLTYCSTCHR